jgi:hypothetical protein
LARALQEVVDANPGLCGTAEAARERVVTEARVVPPRGDPQMN